MKNICLQAIKIFFSTIIFLAGFASLGVLSKDPIVWLDGARPDNTTTPTHLPEECARAAAWSTPKQKYVCECMNR
jgi:hypothetical protein